MNLITTAQAAKIIKCSQDHVNRLLRTGKLDGQKWHNMWVIKKTDAELYKSEPSGNPDAEGRKWNSIYMSEVTMVRDKPTVKQSKIDANLMKLERIQERAKTARYVDAHGDLISEVKWNE
jgi:hypothetical protein